LKPFRNEKGQTTIIVALALIMLLGFVALTVDVGRGFAERAGLQRTADLSAISGALALRGDTPAGTAATAQANLYATDNVSAFRPGQNFASTNCEQLYVNNAPPGGVSTPPAWTPPPVSCSPPVLQSGTCTNVGGVYSCPQPNPCVSQNGVQLQCVYARPASRDFHFLFAPAVGAFAGTRILSAQATADAGTGAPGGTTLAPWLLVDCPVAGLDEPAVVAAAQTYNPQCPPNGYQFQSAGFSGTRTSLLLGTDQSTSGNFQGASLLKPPNCPSPDQGFGGQGGGAQYSNFLQGTDTACGIAPGARMHVETGAKVGPTKQALLHRLGSGVAGCENQASFDGTLTDPDHDGVFAINNDPPNPCLIALALVVHTNPNAPWAANAANNQYHGACCVPSLQAPDPTQRFATLQKGSSEPLLVRRFAYFYITNNTSQPQGTYQVQGVFIRAVDSADNGFGGGACTDYQGICVVKLVN
jgi:hypothetical protein